MNVYYFTIECQIVFVENIFDQLKKSKVYRQKIRQTSNTKQIKIYQSIDFVQLFDIRRMTNRSSIERVFETQKTSCCKYQKFE